MAGRRTRHTYVCGPGVDRLRRRAVPARRGPGAGPVRQPAGAGRPRSRPRLELSLAAASQVEQERAELDRLWRQRLERAAYEAARAERQYQLAEPENRLVVRQLERAWEEKLAAQQQLDEAYHRFAREQPRLLSPAEQATIRRLAADIPALWDAPTTTDADRKAIIRQIVERVTVAVQGESERVQVTITWAGGAETADEIVRPVARLEQLSYYPQLVERLHALAAEGLSPATIAQRLNAKGSDHQSVASALAPRGSRNCCGDSDGGRPTSRGRSGAAAR